MRLMSLDVVATYKPVSLVAIFDIWSLTSFRFIKNENSSNNSAFETTLFYLIWQSQEFLARKSFWKNLVGAHFGS